MATIKDIHNPSYVLFPVNNNRTAWRPFGLPTILVVPHKETSTGLGLANSSVFNVKIFIEDVPTEARVAGHQNVGLRYPDRELYAVNVDNLQLAERAIELNNLIISDQNSGEQISLDTCLLYTSPSPRDRTRSRMPSSA